MPSKVRGKRSADIPVLQRQSGVQNTDPAPQDRNVLPPQKRLNAALTIEQARTFNGTRQLARFAFVLFVFLCCLNAGKARGPSWKPERMPGSAQLAWTQVEHLVVPRERGAALAAAIEDFVEVAADRGIRLSVLDSVERSPKNSLILELSNNLFVVDDGFLLRRDRTRVQLRAASERGWVHALYTLARDELGARWYWPGELGYELVGAANRKLPERRFRARPDFVQRTLHPVDTDFGRRNRLNRKYAFNHNLARIFTPEVYREFPDAFAEIGGRRPEPSQSAKVDPQPDFTSADAIRLSVEAARAHFDAHPNANSFSLSINDNSLFDESAATEAVVRPIDYFRGMPNYSDLVFGYMNAVATAVFEDPRYLETATGEPRYLTALAYYWTEQSPSFELHPLVMPVLTSDRGQWQDPEYRMEDRALIRRWANSGAERIATWDYYFGAPYPYPRQFNRHIAESIPYLKDQGVDVFFSQLPSVWGLDGPKAWLATQLLWDADQDAAKLLGEYYSNFFGTAGDSIRAFYETAEARREAKGGPAKWIKFYKDEAGIELFDTETLQQMRSDLRAAAEAVRDDSKRAARVRVVSEAFKFTETYHAYQMARRKLVEASLRAIASGGEAAASRVAAAWAARDRAKTAFFAVRAGLVSDSMHASLSAFDRIFQSDPSALALTGLAAMADAPDLQLSVSEKAALNAVRSWQAGRLEKERLTANPGLVHTNSERRNFLGPEIPRIEGWTIQYRASQGLAIEATGGENPAGLRIRNADIVSVAQTHPVLGGTNYLLEMEAAWRVSLDNRTWVQLIWRDFSGTTLEKSVPLRLLSSQEERGGIWRFALNAPTNAYGLKIGIVTNRQYAGDFLELRSVEVSELVPPPE